MKLNIVAIGIAVCALVAVLYGQATTINVRTGPQAGATWNLQGYNTGTGGYTTDVTLTAANPPTLDITARNVTVTGTCTGCAAASSLPTGSVILITSGTCPSGFTQAADLDGLLVQGTTAAHGDVGTTGGNATITPSGTNSAPTFTGDALGTHSHTAGTYAAAAQTFTGSSGVVPAETITWPVAVPTAANESAHTHSGSTLTATAQTFTGSSSTVVVNHLHTLATGTGATGNFSLVIGTVDTSSGGTGGTPTQTALGTLSGNPTAGGAANYTPVGTNGTSAVSGTSGAGSAHTHTLSWSVDVPTNGTVNFTPVGTNGSSAVSGTSQAVSAGTPSGTNSAPTFTGNAVNPTPPFMHVIFCRAN